MPPLGLNRRECAALSGESETRERCPKIPSPGWERARVRGIKKADGCVADQGVPMATYRGYATARNFLLPPREQFATPALSGRKSAMFVLP